VGAGTRRCNKELELGAKAMSCSYKLLAAARSWS